MRTRSLAIATIAALTLVPLAACSDDTEAADPPPTTAEQSITTTSAAPAPSEDLAAFCDAGAEIDAATATIDSPAAAVTVFTDLGPTIDEMVATAPADVASDAGAFADHVDDAVASGDFAAFEDGTVDALVANLQAACVGDDQ